MRSGFGKVAITPRVGVELCGFGPFLNRHSIGVRDRLWSRAIALECDCRVVVLVSNDLIQLCQPHVQRTRELAQAATGLSATQVWWSGSPTTNWAMPRIARPRPPSPTATRPAWCRTSWGNCRSPRCMRSW